MKRKDFPRVTPESVGIPSAAVEKLLDTLEFGGFTEPHGLMIYRHGKVCAEGWWSPYAAGMRHAQMSHTKTYAGTAVGIAVTEGLVKLDDRLIDIFPDLAPEEPGEYLKKLRVQDVMCMGAGMPRMPRQELDWVRAFLANEIVYEPGTRFIYSTSCELQAAIVRRVSGLGLMDYLKPRLFDKLGIDTKNLYWARQGDGCEFCSAGLQATTEDNLRLMALYLQKGVWEGERILSEEFVRLATTTRISTVNPDDKRPVPENINPGYGFMLWMCKPEDSYRADGLGGQYTVVLPRQDMIIAITENAADPFRTLDAFWELLKEVRDQPLPEDEEASRKLARRMQRLCVPAEPVAPLGPPPGDGGRNGVAHGQRQRVLREHPVRLRLQRRHHGLRPPLPGRPPALYLYRGRGDPDRPGQHGRQPPLERRGLRPGPVQRLLAGRRHPAADVAAGQRHVHPKDRLRLQGHGL